MTRAFLTQDEYVTYITSLPLVEGEVLCTSFLPSTLFSKDDVAQYYAHFWAVPDSEVLTEQLRSYGQRVWRAVIEARATLCIETEAIRQLCKTGIIHQASPHFTATYSSRVSVLSKLQHLNRTGKVYLTPGPIPFVFRLHPPHTVVVDVRLNTSRQLVQGLLVEAPGTFGAFSAEAKRLIWDSQPHGTGEQLEHDLQEAVRRLRMGEEHTWPR